MKILLWNIQQFGPTRASDPAIRAAVAKMFVDHWDAQVWVLLELTSMTAVDVLQEQLIPEIERIKNSRAAATANRYEGSTYDVHIAATGRESYVVVIHRDGGGGAVNYSRDIELVRPEAVDKPAAYDFRAPPQATFRGRREVGLLPPPNPPLNVALYVCHAPAADQQTLENFETLVNACVGGDFGGEFILAGDFNISSSGSNESPFNRENMERLQDTGIFTLVPEGFMSTLLSGRGPVDFFIVRGVRARGHVLRLIKGSDHRPVLLDLE